MVKSRSHRRRAFKNKISLHLIKLGYSNQPKHSEPQREIEEVLISKTTLLGLRDQLVTPENTAGIQGFATEQKVEVHRERTVLSITSSVGIDLSHKNGIANKCIRTQDILWEIQSLIEYCVYECIHS